MTSRYGGQLHQRDGRSQYSDNNYNGDSSNSSPYRASTPNRYSHAVLDELESQNNDYVEGLSAKVQILKKITQQIGTEVKDSTEMMNQMNDTFENTKVRLRGTMNRMLRMAEKAGIGWKTWVLFFIGVFGLFWYVWLF